MAAALLRSQQARLWADILTPAAKTSAAGALWQGRSTSCVWGLQVIRSLPAPGTTCWLGKGSQQLRKQPSTASPYQKDTATNKQQTIAPVCQATEQAGQRAASQGGPGQEPVKRQVKQDTLWRELRNLLTGPLQTFMARWAMSRNSRIIEEEFDVSQFLEGCKGAFVAVHEGRHSTRDLARMVSLPVLEAYAAYVNMTLTRTGRSVLPMPGIAADDEHQDCPNIVDAKEAQNLLSLWSDMREGLVVGSSLVIRVRFSGCSFVLETRDSVTGDLIEETLDQRCSTWIFGRGPLPNLTYPVREFGADLPWVVFFTD